MPIADQKEELVDCICSDEDLQIFRYGGRVYLPGRYTAIYCMQANSLDEDDTWTLELFLDGDLLGVVLLLYSHLSLGFTVVDPMPDEYDAFPDYDSRVAFTKEKFLNSSHASSAFALLDEICIADHRIREYLEKFREYLFCLDLGPFYVADALKLVPRLQKDGVDCVCFLQSDDDWCRVSWEHFQKAEIKHIAIVRISREHEGHARYHEGKLFPKGTSYFQENDSGEDGWIDQATLNEAHRDEKYQTLQYEWNYLLHQKSALEEEIVAVQKELFDVNNHWRYEALQRAQQKNRAEKSRIENAMEKIALQMRELEH